MQPFCFNPSTNRETLRDFNERVQEFCLEEGAINIGIEVSGKYLILKVFTPQDQEFPEGMTEGIPSLMPSVRMLDAKEADWEEQIAALMESEEAKATDDDPVREAVDVRVVQNGHDSTKAWAVVMVVTGEIDPASLDGDDGDGGDGNDGDGSGGDPVPPLDGAVSFQPNASQS